MSRSREVGHAALRSVPQQVGTGRSGSDTHLHGRALTLARATWATLVLLVLGVFVMGLPETVRQAQALKPETIAGLAQLGLSPSFNAIYMCVLDALTLLGFVAFAVLIFWRRSDDWMVMLVGLTLLLTGMLYTAPPFEAAVPLLLLALLAGLAEVSQIAFVLLFPDGRFFPGGAGSCSSPCWYGVQRCGGWSTSRTSWPSRRRGRPAVKISTTSHRIPEISRCFSPCSSSASSPRSIAIVGAPRRFSGSRQNGWCSASA